MRRGGASEVSVVVVAQNVREELRMCLESLKHALPLSSEVIVVDNASTDGSARMVMDEHPYVRIARNKKDLGPARAANQGVDMSGGAYVMLLDPRLQLYPGAVRDMVGFLEINMRHGACVPRLLLPDGATVSAHMRLPTLATALWLGTPIERWRAGRTELAHHFACDFDYDAAANVEASSGACVLMRRRALKRAFTIDEGLWPHFHVADLFARIREAGWRTAYLPQVLALDAEEAGQAHYPELTQQWHAQRLAWYRRHLGSGAAWWVKACVGWTVAHRLASEIRRRINGLRQEPILPVWREYAGLLRS